MSDTPTGPDWWQASDNRWYPPETHPEYRAPEPMKTAGISDFEPPRTDQRFPTPDDQPPGVGPMPGPPLSADQVPGAGYPVAPNKKRSNGKILAIIFGVAFLLLAGGCGLFVYNFRDEIADATIDFADSEVVDDQASCEVIGADFGGNYEVEVTLEASADAVSSHYQVTFEILVADGELLGAEKTVLRSMQPGERRTEGAFNSIVASNDVETVVCEVNGVRRVSA